MLNLRPYQQEAEDAVFDYWAEGGGNPLVEMATGTGKSLVIASIAKRLCQYPGFRVLVLVHVQELVEQNFMAFMRAWPGAPAGIYSAGLGRRDAHHQITFASIQSVYKKAAVLGRRKAALIDEAHLVPQSGGGMYQELLLRLRDQDPDMRVAGFTATAYRMDSGLLAEGENRLFDETVYSYGVGRGIGDGFLSPLVSKGGVVEIDVGGVARRGGEFVAGALEAAANVDAITRSAVNEIATLGADRRSWLVFCSGVKHAFAVRDAMRSIGISCETITGETDKGERAATIRNFKAGRIRCLTNAQVLTTGFDAPAVDLVAMLRPTLSTGLYVQIVGRGTRLAEGKTNCLILDYAGNVRRHGPVDTIEIKPKRQRKEDDSDSDEKTTVDSVKAKECPSCKNLIGFRCQECPECGHIFPLAELPKHDPVAEAMAAILSTEKLKPVDIPVITWECRSWAKPGAPESMRVSFFAGIQEIPEWVCFEHGGRAGALAGKWWRQHGGALPVPATAREGISRWSELTCPASIAARRNGKYFEITSRKMPAIREAAE